MMQVLYHHLLPYLHLLLLSILHGNQASAVSIPVLQNYRYQLLHVSSLPSKHPKLPQSTSQSFQWSSSSHDKLKGKSLTFRLVHRDSPFSPLHSPHADPRLLLQERLSRDKARVHALSVRAKLASAGNARKNAVVSDFRDEATGGFAGPIVSGWNQGSGEYFVRLGVGTPPRQIYLVVDTGSDIIWMQCAPCLACYQQTDPVFNPAQSSSYRRIACTSPTCRLLESHSCGLRRGVCVYQVAYGDGSFTEGDFIIETMSFEGGAVGDVAMGCGHDNEGLFAGAAGLFGLGGGPLSFPSQMGSQMSRVFSYCLMDKDGDSSSSLVFGEGGMPGETAYTPLLRNRYLSTYYYVTMVGISVGGRMLGIPEEAFKMDVSGNGGVIVDSGTSVTRLVEVAYGPLRSAFRAAMRDLGLPFAGGVSLFDTCYALAGRGRVNVPSLSFHFEGGAQMDLPAGNYVIPVDGQGTYCLALASTDGGLSIIGNIQQQGFRVVFDGVSSRLGFAANQC